MCTPTFDLGTDDLTTQDPSVLLWMQAHDWEG